MRRQFTSAIALKWVWLLLCFFILRPLSARSKHLLVEAKPIKIAGTIEREHRGNNAYLMLRPAASYEAAFDANDHRTVDEIGLSLMGQGEVLDRLIGQKVTVTGVLQLEPASPYYFNGTLIEAKSVRLRNGSILLPQTVTISPLPKEITQFSALVTFSPRTLDRFFYRAWDGSGHPLPASGVYLSCGLNGAGDVMNCSCAEGFKFVASGTITNGHFSKTAGPQEGFDFAQFVIAEPVRHYVKQAIACVRSGSQQ